MRENGEILLKAQAEKPNLNFSKNQINKIVRILADYIQKRFGSVPSKNQKESAARALIEIFPSIKMVR